MLGIEEEYIDDAIVEELSHRVQEGLEEPAPLSKYAVAVQLELMGITDAKLRHNFENTTLFNLSERVYRQILKNLEANNINRDSISGKRLLTGSVWERVTSFLKYYGIGLLFMAPMFSQILSVVFISYSLWAWLYFNELQATVVAIGTIIAFIATGGINMFAGREISHYMSQKNYNLCYKASRKILGMGLLYLFGLGLFIYTMNLIVPFFPHQMMILGSIYMFFIGLWLLSSTLLYALQKTFMILVSVLLGTLVLAAAMEIFDIGIYLSHWMGIFFSSLVMILYGVVFFKRNSKKSNDNNFEQYLPKFVVQYYNHYPYLIYGTCYFLFLFMDRILAWSAGTPPPAYVIWFDTSYELGMDWALLCLVFITASLEYSINQFSSLILPFQKKTDIKDRQNFNAFFKHFYMRQVFLLIVVGVISILGSYFLVMSLKSLSSEVQIVEDFFSSNILTKLYWLASIGYLFTSYGLLNTLFFFTLGRPEKMVHAITIAIIVNLLVGFVCSRLISYEYAVLGLVAGSIAFAIITTYYARELFQKLHYYYYSAY